jgi:hypothetical protein
MQVENGRGSVNCFELHPNLQGYADQTTPKEAALLLCCVSRGARYIPEQAPRQRANLPIQFDSLSIGGGCALTMAVDAAITMAIGHCNRRD